MKTSAREIVGALVSPHRGRRAHRCVYCGRRSWGRACSAHLDLPQLEMQTQSPSRTDQEVARGTGFDNNGG